MRLPLPPQARLARMALRYGPLLAPYARRLYEQGRFRQLAILHARTLDGGTFSWEIADGERIWVVWVEDGAVATYPDRRGLLERDDPFPGALADRRTDPEELTVRRIRRRATELDLPGPLGRRGGGETDEDRPDAAD